MHSTLITKPNNILPDRRAQSQRSTDSNARFALSNLQQSIQHFVEIWSSRLEVFFSKCRAGRGSGFAGSDANARSLLVNIAISVFGNGARRAVIIFVIRVGDWSHAAAWAEGLIAGATAFLSFARLAIFKTGEVIVTRDEDLDFYFDTCVAEGREGFLKLGGNPFCPGGIFDNPEELNAAYRELVGRATGGDVKKDRKCECAAR